LNCGASVVLGIPPGPENLLAAIEKYSVTVASAVPSSYRMMLPHLRNYRLGSLRQCISAGEALPVGTRRAWFDATGIQLIDGIGATEMLHIFISAAGKDIRPGAIGKPLPGYHAAILDSEGQPLPPGQVGRLGVKGPIGCRYLDDPRQTDYVKNGWNLTGDAFMMDADGYFFYQARADDMIISCGNNIGGPEVEDALLKHDAVMECAVIGVADEERGQVVKAYVVLRDGWADNDETRIALQDHVKREIAPYKYPRIIEFRQALPRTETGKLQRFKLREESSRLPAQPGNRTMADSHQTENDSTAIHLIEPSGWDRPKGFSNGVKIKGWHVSVAGQIGWDAKRKFHSDNFTEQSRQALQNVVDVVRAAGGKPEHIVRLTWFITDKHEYLAQSRELGMAYRSVMGHFYPPMTVVQVAGLLEDAAKVEIEATAIIPE
jgi:enamine deaminase RidA (YjgF/YER057c/UK114 family)